MTAEHKYFDQAALRQNAAEECIVRLHVSRATDAGEGQGGTVRDWIVRILASSAEEGHAGRPARIAECVRHRVTARV
jgi:hypothetical protein